MPVPAGIFAIDKSIANVRRLLDMIMLEQPLLEFCRIAHFNNYMTTPTFE